jgi:hypothetical protein
MGADYVQVDNQLRIFYIDDAMRCGILYNCIRGMVTFNPVAFVFMEGLNVVPIEIFTDEAVAPVGSPLKSRSQRQGALLLIWVCPIRCKGRKDAKLVHPRDNQAVQKEVLAMGNCNLRPFPYRST